MMSLLQRIDLLWFVSSYGQMRYGKDFHKGAYLDKS